MFNIYSKCFVMSPCHLRICSKCEICVRNVKTSCQDRIKVVMPNCMKSLYVPKIPKLLCYVNLMSWTGSLIVVDNDYDNDIWMWKKGTGIMKYDQVPRMIWDNWNCSYGWCIKWYGIADRAVIGRHAAHMVVTVLEMIIEIVDMVDVSNEMT